MVGSSTWKERCPKSRISFAPVIQYSKVLGFRPAFVVPVQQRSWSLKPEKIEEKTVNYRNSEYKLLRKSYKDFVTYYAKKSWFNGAIFEWELQRLSHYLKKKTPNTKYLLMLDNVPSHLHLHFDNLKLLFLPPNTTAQTQPLDCSVFAVTKNKYYKWLIHETLVRGPEHIKLESCVCAFARIFNELDIRVINNGFKKTKLSLFQSEPTMETELTQEEQVMNLIERMDKFQCSDSEDE